MTAFTLMGDALQKYENEYHGKFYHTIGHIQHNNIMTRIENGYLTCQKATKSVPPTLFGFQGIKRCIHFIADHTNKNIFYTCNDHYGYNVIRLTLSVYQAEEQITNNLSECH